MTNLEAALKYAEMGMSVIVAGKDKIPFGPWGIYQKRKATPDEIRGWFKQYDNPNIGIVTGAISNLLVVDCDSQEAIDQVEATIPDNMMIPTTTTPGGGRHYYFSHIEGLSNKANYLSGLDVRTSGGYIVAPPSENGNGKKYSWIENNGLAEIPAPQIHSQLFNLLKNAVNSSSLNNINIIASNMPENALFQKGRRDDDLFHYAHVLASSKEPEWKIRQVLEILARNCIPPFPERELYQKIESAIKRIKIKDRNISAELREWVAVTSGYFNVTTIYNELQVVTKEQKAAIRVALHRLCKDGVILQDKNKDGLYRLVNKTIKEIDLDDRSDLIGELQIKFPFGIENYIKPMPGCVYIIAGETDSGKSAFLMNFAKKNTPRHKVHYFSSEMGKQELLDRTDYFWPNVGKDKNFVFYEDCYSDFNQMIKPDDINIIDYLELYDEFYKMAEKIDDIGKALGNGICFIALQKPKNREEGLGGERTKNLARLYLSLSPGLLKIVKAKNWRDPKVNPNGLSIPWKLVSGCNFLNTDSWMKK